MTKCITNAAVILPVVFDGAVDNNFDKFFKKQVELADFHLPTSTPSSSPNEVTASDAWPTPS